MAQEAEPITRDAIDKWLKSIRKKANEGNPLRQYTLIFHPNDPRIKIMRDLGYRLCLTAPAS